MLARSQRFIGPSSRPTNRVAARDDPIDQACDCLMHFSIGIWTDGILVCCRGVVEHPHDLTLGKKLVIVYGKQERLAYGERRHSGVVSLVGHRGLSFMKMQNQDWSGILTNFTSLAGIRLCRTDRKQPRDGLVEYF